MWNFFANERHKTNPFGYQIDLNATVELGNPCNIATGILRINELTPRGNSTQQNEKDIEHIEQPTPGV